MSQQQSFLTQARPTDLKQPILRAPNDDRYRGHQEGQTRYINGIASQSGAGVPVPRGPTNGHGKMGSLSGQGFAGARSPPSAKSMYHGDHMDHQHVKVLCGCKLTIVKTHLTYRVNSTNKALVRLGVLVHTLMLRILDLVNTSKKCALLASRDESWKLM